jgi:hypothetical protein
MVGLAQRASTQPPQHGREHMRYDTSMKHVWFQYSAVALRGASQMQIRLVRRPQPSVRPPCKAW